MSAGQQAKNATRVDPTVAATARVETATGDATTAALGIAEIAWIAVETAVATGTADLEVRPMQKSTG